MDRFVRPAAILFGASIALLLGAVLLNSYLLPGAESRLLWRISIGETIVVLMFALPLMVDLNPPVALRKYRLLIWWATNTLILTGVLMFANAFMPLVETLKITTVLGGFSALICLVFTGARDDQNQAQRRAGLRRTYGEQARLAFFDYSGGLMDAIAADKGLTPARHGLLVQIDTLYKILITLSRHPWTAAEYHDAMGRLSAYDDMIASARAAGWLEPPVTMEIARALVGKLIKPGDIDPDVPDLILAIRNEARDRAPAAA